MKLGDAKNRVLTLVRNSAPFGGTGARQPFSGCALRNVYPRADAVVPTVALSESGGPVPVPTGLGTSQRRHQSGVQMDVLARNRREASRIWDRVVEVIRNDYDRYPADGTWDKGFLRAQGVRSVVVGEPTALPWDDENRVARLSGQVEIRFDDAVPSSAIVVEAAPVVTTFVVPAPTIVQT